MVTRVIVSSWLSQGNVALTVQAFVLLILVLGAAFALLLRRTPAPEFQ
jgi:flagellar motor component MotA